MVVVAGRRSTSRRFRTDRGSGWDDLGDPRTDGRHTLGVVMIAVNLCDCVSVCVSMKRQMQVPVLCLSKKPGFVLGNLEGILERIRSGTAIFEG